MIISDIPESDRSAIRDLASGMTGSGGHSYLESIEGILSKHFAPDTDARKILFSIFSCVLWCKQNSQDEPRDPIESIKGKRGFTETQARRLRRTLSLIGIGAGGFQPMFFLENSAWE